MRCHFPGSELVLIAFAFYTEEKVEETKTENEADESTAKPNENQLSLSMCVNTDDVQDDLDEDLKQIEKVKSNFFN